MNNDCLFCQIVAGQLPARVAFQNDTITVIHDINPQAPTHLLIIPRRHLTSVAEAQSGDAQLLGELLQTGAQLARDAGLERGYRLVINTGAEGGQSVAHLHVHLLGGRPMGWPPG